MHAAVKAAVQGHIAGKKMSSRGGGRGAGKGGKGSPRAPRITAETLRQLSDELQGAEAMSSDTAKDSSGDD